MGVEVGLEDLSREEFIAQLTKATISAKSKGSPPTSGNNTSYLSTSDEEESILDDSSNAGSSSGSRVESSKESKDGEDS